MGDITLAGYGIDWGKSLNNCIGDRNFHKKILDMFLEDQCFSKAKDAYMSDDRKELFARMHELKGISGNVALDDLYGATVPLVELLRVDSEKCDKAEIDRLFAACEEAYDRAYEGVKLYIENNY